MREELDGLFKSNGAIPDTKMPSGFEKKSRRGDPDGIKRNLTAIVPHSYGEHGGCDRKWCRAGDANNRHSSLPRGKNLTDQAVREDIEKVIDPYTNAKMTEKLPTLSTTNSNENMNMMISRKAAKGSHYSESESLGIRVSVTVAQKTDGHAYILKELDKKRLFNATQHRTVKQKRRRIELKEQRIRNDRSAEVHEGKTYETAINATDDITPDDIVESSPPLLLPSMWPSVSAPQPDTLIVFDIEITGLAQDSDIIQLSAKHLDTGDTFSAYIRPAGGRIPTPSHRLPELQYMEIKCFIT
ncbi:uncharacterized protein LOC128215169 [Mya arenaria]|uniref:uncharacterized protein LOC128215169 n=1 Tax=Mya arenaria TaxID=6604 RepID=UPI0022E01158|nr:uncharacterized protein LOC128215169 [Mya arenaria]